MKQRQNITFIGTNKCQNCVFIEGLRFSKILESKLSNENGIIYNGKITSFISEFFKIIQPINKNLFLFYKIFENDKIETSAYINRIKLFVEILLILLKESKNSQSKQTKNLDIISKIKELLSTNLKVLIANNNSEYSIVLENCLKDN